MMEIVIPLDEVTKENNEKTDLSHVYMVGFSTALNTTLFIKEMYLSNEDPTGVGSVLAPQEDSDIIYYDLLGRSVKKPKSGIYIRSLDNKKVLIR